LFGQTRSPTEWEGELFQFAAAPGARVEVTNTQDMLAQARDSFRPAYAAFSNEPIAESNLRVLGRNLKAAIDDPSFTAGKNARETVTDFVNSQLQPMSDRFTATGALTTGDLIEVRRAVRAEQRRVAGSTSADIQDRSQVLEQVENVLTDNINSALSPDLLDGMSVVDGQYRKYKVLEDAVIRSGERGLNPDVVSDAIRRSSTSPGQFATGGDAEFRTLALTGWPIEQLLSDPETQ
jgi:hypothetical protein